MRTASFPVAVKLCAFACALMGTILGGSLAASGALALLAFAHLAAQKNWRLVRAYGLFYLLLCALLLLIRYRGLRMVIFSEFYVIMFFSLMPVFLVSWDLITTPPGELSAFLSAIRTPTPVILGVLVLFRFFPTMKAELSGIRQSMGNRGLTAPARVLRHPAATFEYVLVPMLLRCLQVADQLSVSAVARGAESPERRGSYYAKPMNGRGYLWMALWAVGTAAILLWGGAV